MVAAARPVPVRWWFATMLAALLGLAGGAASAMPAASVFTTVDEGVRLDRLLAGAYDRQFLPVSGAAVELDGGLRYTHWLRLEIDPGTLREGVLRLERVPVDRITLYRAGDEALPQEQTVRFFAPAAADGAMESGYQFDVPVARPGPLVLYLAVSTRVDVALAPRFLAPREAHLADRGRSNLMSAVYAALVVLTLGALALFVALRETAYLHFVGYCASLLLVLAAANGQVYALPGLGFLAWWGPLGQASLVLVHAALALGFAQHFLGTDRLDANLDRWLDYSRYALFALAAFALVNLSQLVEAAQPFAALAWMATALVALLLGVFGWQRGQPVSRAWTLTWLLVAGAVVYRGLFVLGLLEPGFGVAWGYQPVLAVGAFLLSIGLADRVMEFRKQRDRARLLKEQTDASLQVEQRRRELVDGLREQLRGAPSGDLEWIAMRRLLAATSALLPQSAAAVIANGYREMDLLLAEPAESKERFSRLMAVRGGNIRGLCRGRTPVQVKLEAGEEEGESAGVYAVVPLRIAKPGWGAVLVERQPWEEFQPDELKLVAEFAQIAVSAADEVASDVELRRRAELDALTGALNRRAADMALEDLFRHALDQRLPLSVLLVDLDHFKVVNDKHGSAFGDDCLRAVAEVLRRHLQPEDQFARYGGEEFLVMLPGRQPDQARQVAERLREQVNKLALRAEAGPVRLSVSIGVAARSGSEEQASTLVQRAERAVQVAKRNGRNQVQVAVSYGFGDKDPPPDDIDLLL